MEKEVESLVDMGNGVVRFARRDGEED